MEGWSRVVVILLVGEFGVHKFLDGNKKMGFFYLFTVGLFGIGWMIDLVLAILDAVNGNDMSRGYRTNVILEVDESCIYSVQASYAKTKNVVVGYAGGGTGMSVRVTNNLSFHTGSGAKKAIRGDIVEKYPGLLTITNKRIIFSGTKGSFDKKITSLSAATPYKDAVAFQFGETSYPLLVKNVSRVTKAVQQAVNSNREQ